MKKDSLFYAPSEMSPASLSRSIAIQTLVDRMSSDLRYLLCESYVWMSDGTLIISAIDTPLIGMRLRKRCFSIVSRLAVPLNADWIHIEGGYTHPMIFRVRDVVQYSRYSIPRGVQQPKPIDRLSAFTKCESKILPASVFTNEGKILYANSRVADYGVGAIDCVGRYCAEFIGAEEFHKMMGHLQKNGELRDYEFTATVGDRQYWTNGNFEAGFVGSDRVWVGTYEIMREA